VPGRDPHWEIRMGIFGALATAVSGLRAQSYAMENISGNIANSQTTGFKRQDTSFVDLIPSASANRQVAGSVTSQARSTNSIAGDIQSSSTETHIALNGEGYFTISEARGQSDGRPLFADTPLYTRRGDFELDKSGFLKNGAGYYLNALPIDPTTGNVTGSIAGPIQLGNNILPATASTRIEYQGNLPKYPLTNSADPTVPGSELLNAADYADFTTEITGAEEANFIDQSISGQSITLYDIQGSPVNVQLRWAKTDNTAGAETWNLFYLSDSAAGAADPKWTNTGTDYVFGANGQLNPPIATAPIAALTVNGNNLGNIDMQYGTGNLTQFADTNGAVNLTRLDQNGYSAGTVTGLAITESGRISANYSNGQIRDIAQIPIVDFNNPNGLKRIDGGAFAVTNESGPAIPSSTATVIGASLEGSNSDIADEFTKLIVTQQAYSANTRIITSADEMLQEALNMVR
jgi:flagellar hook protein FlgE